MLSKTAGFRPLLQRIIYDVSGCAEFDCVSTTVDPDLHVLLLWARVCRGAHSRIQLVSLTDCPPHPMSIPLPRLDAPQLQCTLTPTRPTAHGISYPMSRCTGRHTQPHPNGWELGVPASPDGVCRQVVAASCRMPLTGGQSADPPPKTNHAEQKTRNRHTPTSCSRTRPCPKPKCCCWRQTEKEQYLQGGRSLTSVQTAGSTGGLWGQTDKAGSKPWAPMIRIMRRGAGRLTTAAAAVHCNCTRTGGEALAREKEAAHEASP